MHLNVSCPGSHITRAIANVLRTVSTLAECQEGKTNGQPTSPYLITRVYKNHLTPLLTRKLCLGLHDLIYPMRKYRSNGSHLRQILQRIQYLRRQLKRLSPLLRRRKRRHKQEVVHKTRSNNT